MDATTEIEKVYLDATTEIEKEYLDATTEIYTQYDTTVLPPNSILHFKNNSLIRIVDYTVFID